jgi:hypothetical protein
MSIPQQPFRMQNQRQATRPPAEPRYDEDGNEIIQELSYDTSFVIPRVHNRTPTVPPVGLYIVRLTGVFKETDNRFNPDVDRLRFDFTMLHVIDSEDPRKAAEFVNSIVHGWCNNTMGPKATLRAWGEAILQRQFEDDEQSDISEWIGKVVKATYVSYMKENGQQGVKLSHLSPYIPDDATRQVARQPAGAAPAPRPAAASPNPASRQSPVASRQRQQAPRPPQDDGIGDDGVSNAFDGDPNDDPWGPTPTR